MGASAEQSEDLAYRLAKVDACAVSDALDRLGILGVACGIICQSGSEHRVAGRAVTVRIVPRRDDTPRPHLCTGAIMGAGPGDVIVVSNQGRLDVSCWGGILSLAAAERGIEGVVVDGACRDVAEAAELSFPVFARATVPMSARGRVVEESMGGPVTVGPVQVHSGDLVVADRNGVVFIPAERAEEVLEFADRIVAGEKAMAIAVRAGQSIVEVMHDRSFDRIEAVR